MEFFYFILLIIFLLVFGKSSKDSTSKNKKDNIDDLLAEVEEDKSFNDNWDVNYYHKITKVHYPEFKFDDNGWSVSKVYLPKTNTNEYININTGDKYNKLGIDYLGNKEVRFKRKTYLPDPKNKKLDTKDIEKVLSSPPIKIKKILKPMWKSMNPFLDFVNIDKFYHFTDKRNLQSIIDNGGLYTWNGLKNKNINGYITSDDISHSLDKRKGLENYVRLSFVDYHPMSSYVKDKRNIQLIWLEVDRCVSTFEDTLYSDMNATDNNVTISGEFSFLKKLNFSIFKEDYRLLSLYEKKQYQSEILVKDFLPLEYITNLESLKERHL
jgi:hypothetical protein